MSVELLIDARAELGEGPAWDAAAGLLYWVDIHAGTLHTFNPQAATDHRAGFHEPLGCAVPARAGGVLLALQSGAVIYDPLTTARRPVNLPACPPGMRFNDGKCDPAGRLLVGTMDDAEKEANGVLYSLDAAGNPQTLLTGLGISNGMAWSPDHRTFYFIDTPTRLVMAYDYDLASGQIFHPRPVIHIPQKLGWPDGMASDQEGLLWIALWGGASLTCWDPHSGQMAQAYPVPALNVTSCAFGGPNLDDLYITSARKGMDASQLAAYPASGGLFCIHTTRRGMPTFVFEG